MIYSFPFTMKVLWGFLFSKEIGARGCLSLRVTPQWPSQDEWTLVSTFPYKLCYNPALSSLGTSSVDLLSPSSSYQVGSADPT